MKFAKTRRDGAPSSSRQSRQPRQTAALQAHIISLYEAEPDLATLPGVLFATVGPLVDADVVTYGEFHEASGDFRTIVSVPDDPSDRAARMAAFARHRSSHPFWISDPALFGERALRDTDFFTDEEFFALPIAREVFLPANAHHSLAIVIAQHGYTLSVAAHRVCGRPAFSDAQRDDLATFRSHVQRAYQQAQLRTISALPPVDRLRHAFPDLTKRQLEVAAWIAEGKSNETIAAILGIGLDAVKSHVRAVLEKTGSESRLGVAVHARAALPFDKAPPLWTLPVPTWEPPGALGATFTPKDDVAVADHD